MKRDPESSLRRWLFAMAAFAVIMALIACSNSSSTSTATSDAPPADAGNALSPIKTFERDFNGQTITTFVGMAMMAIYYRRRNNYPLRPP